MESIDNFNDNNDDNTENSSEDSNIDFENWGDMLSNSTIHNEIEKLITEFKSKSQKISINKSDSNFERLKNEIEENKNELKETLKSINELKRYITNLIPKDQGDYKNRYLLDEKLKVISTIYNLELDARKTLNNLILTLCKIEGMDL